MASIRFCFDKFSGPSCWKLTLFLCLASLLTTSQVLAAGIPQRWEVKEYQPPEGMGTPNRTAGAGTRSPAPSCPVVGQPLTALLPTSGFGVTVAAYPAFSVFVPALSPQTPPLPIEFSLQDANGNEVYKATFPTNGTPGIVMLNLPNQGGLTPLTVGQDYRWSFSIICQGNDRSRDISVQGWIRRVPLNPTLSSQLQQASPQQKVELYAEAEIWHDALATLIQLRRDYPNDSAIALTWQKLMSAAGLTNFTQEALLPNTISTRPITLLQP